MRKTMLYIILLLALWIDVIPAGAQTTNQLDIQKLMTPAEQKATGVSSLSATQIAALNRWWSQYTVAVGKVYKEMRHTSASSEYGGLGSGHWIQTNGDGKIITLEDGSMWEIESTDQIDTALWLPMSNITVTRGSEALAGFGFRYVLVNTDDGEKASAKFLGSSH